MKVPHAVRPYADRVVAATTAVCLGHLDVEYAGLCRGVVGKLGRKRPSPLTRGDLDIWAAGVVRPSASWTLCSTLRRRRTQPLISSAYGWA